MKIFLTALFVLLVSSVAFGAAFTVNTNTDTNDANLADNICLDSAGFCSLRAAIQQANALSSNDVISFDSSVQLITLSSQTEILISDAGTLQINGSGANVLTISGGTSYNRIFRIVNATVNINGVTLRDGGIDSFTSFGGDRNGAAISQTGGSLTVERVYFVNNFAGSNSTSGDIASGGAIYLLGGTHTIRNSTFANNYASTGGGGAVAVRNGGLLDVVNSTFSGNSAIYQGGAFYNEGTVRMNNSTVTSNIAYKSGGSFATGFGGGIFNGGGTFTLNNTIIAGNTVQSTAPTLPFTPEIYISNGSVISTGNNFVGDSTNDSNSTGMPIAYQPTDIRDIPPMIDATLANNGGTTPTRALLANSPAINAANSNAPPTDQRGAPRVNAPDIGAYEYGALLFTISGRVTSDGTNGLNGVTVTLSGSNSATTTTNANGEYSFSGLNEGGNYTVTPTLAGVTFSPLNATFNNLSGNQTANFRPQCEYSINPTSATISAAGGTASFNITASAGCSWTATTTATFISITSGTGAGSGTISYTVQPNSGAVRSGTITAAGLTFTVNQTALPTLSINSIALPEGNSGTTPFPFTVTLSAASSQTVTVNYATVNGTATPPSDYQGTAGTLTFAAGETSKTITILVNGDTTVEPNETFTVNLSGAVNAVIAVAQGTAIIRNDEGQANGKLFDFDGDGKVDIAVFRPSNGFWYRLNSSNNTFSAVQFGQAGDFIAPADYDGDGKTDIAVWRPGAFAYFYILNSSDNSFRFEQFGTERDLPMPGDWDTDGKADLAVYRGSFAGAPINFYYRPTAQPTVDYYTFTFGATGDRPIYGDFDGDGRLDPAVFRSNSSSWIILKSSTNQYTTVTFGTSTDIPAVADFDGDGIANIAVFRPSTGTWYTSTNPATNYGAIVFGTNGDTLVPADYDGDGRADAAVFRPSNGAWYLQRTTNGFTGVAFGQNGDKPIPNAYLYY